MVRKILGTIAGLVVAIIIIMIVQMISTMLHPMPEGLSMDDKQGFANYIETLPVTAFILVILSYVMGTFGGAFVATKISKTRYIPAMVIAVFLILGGIANAMSIPQPIWVSVVSLLVFLPAAYLGAKAVRL